MLAMRLFKAFSAQPRLAVMTRTLYESSVDVGHFFVVFCTIFLAFSAMAQHLFGHELAEFVTLARASQSSFRVLVGEFDWDAMRTGGRSVAAIWLTSFVVLIVFVMLNMLLSIVMDTSSSRVVRVRWDCVRFSSTESTNLFLDGPVQCFREWFSGLGLVGTPQSSPICSCVPGRIARKVIVV